MSFLRRMPAGRGHEEEPAEVIDLGEEEEAEPPAPPRQVWGRPGPCPLCSGRGYLDHIDMVDRIMFQHCTECGHRWQLTEADLQTAAS